MKIIIRLLIIFDLFLIQMGTSSDQVMADEPHGTLTLSGAWALYPMAVKWAEEFQKIYPDVHVDIAAGGAGKGMADALANVVDIGMVSREINPAEIKKGAWWIPVTKDAVIATVNDRNPSINEILNQGIDRETFQEIWITGKITSLDDVVNYQGKHQIHVYTRSDACGAAETWAKYLGKNQEDLLGVGVYGDPGLAEAVKKDQVGFGYNNINYVYDSASKLPIAGIKIVPIDLNDNGKLDADESFYATRDDLIQAIANGKYPSPPARDLYFVCGGKPNNKLVISFIEWVLTDGQKYVPESGYINLSSEQLSQHLLKLK